MNFNGFQGISRNYKGFQRTIRDFNPTSHGVSDSVAPMIRGHIKKSARNIKILARFKDFKNFELEISDHLEKKKNRQN